MATRKREQREFMEFLLENKRNVDKTVEEFNYHSREFDRKVNRILANL